MSGSSTSTATTTAGKKAPANMRELLERLAVVGALIP
jgi:hypothetical protein